MKTKEEVLKEILGIGEYSSIGDELRGISEDDILNAMESYATLSVEAALKKEWVSVETPPAMGQDVICTDNFTCYSIGWYSEPEGFFTDKKMNVTHWTPTAPNI